VLHFSDQYLTLPNIHLNAILLPRDATQSAVMPQYTVCPSVGDV